VGRSARARVADSVSRWLDWTETNRTVYLATIAHGEDIADPDVRRVVADLVQRAVALLKRAPRATRRLPAHRAALRRHAAHAAPHRRSLLYDQDWTDVQMTRASM